EGRTLNESADQTDVRAQLVVLELAEASGRGRAHLLRRVVEESNKFILTELAKARLTEVGSENLCCPHAVGFSAGQTHFRCRTCCLYEQSHGTSQPRAGDLRL